MLKIEMSIFDIRPFFLAMTKELGIVGHQDAHALWFQPCSHI
jgi:hypothetical protein